MTVDFSLLLREGAYIHSSGTTGPRKTIFRSPTNLRAHNVVARQAQGIDRDSRIYTVCKPDHAAGLLAQSLPGYSCGAHVEMAEFNAFSFLGKIREYTHTMLTPTHLRLIRQTKTFSDFQFNGFHILTGSDPVEYDLIRDYVERGAVVQPNWGMSEIGPICINTTFRSLEQVDTYQSMAIPGGTIMGDKFFTEWNIRDSILYVKSPTCHVDDWMCTNDIVALDQNMVMYWMGRNAGT